ncbi:MAG: AraC family transcriptional regulator ligand-binding domain-containing protein [Spongiibacteraceae bacterium]
MASINSYYFRVCTEGARRRGVDVDALLHTADIEPAQIQDPLWRGSAATMAQLVRQIWLTLGDEYMGYTPTRVRPGAFALMAELALHSGTVLQALEKAMRFYNVISADIRTDITVLEHDVRIDVFFYEPALDPDHYFVEFWLIIWHRFACWLAGETISLHAAEFNYPKPELYFEEFKYLFPCPHRFNRPNCLIKLDLQQLRGPIRRTEAELREMLQHAPLDLMSIPASDHSLTRRVRLLLHDIEKNTPTLEGMAKAVAMSAENFRRQLRREGTTLSRLVESQRRDLAIRRLLDGNRTVEEIASQLGYAEARSFTRAFRAWTGVSPSAYRRKFGRR